MTEGIIQKVFKKKFREMEQRYAQSLDIPDIKEIEQELIQEIRKEFSDFNVSWLIDAQTIRQNIISSLIGETKE